MNKRYYVVTNPEDGWDCVSGVYLASSEEEVAITYAKEMGEDITADEADEYMEERNLIIHQTSFAECN